MIDLITKSIGLVLCLVALSIIWTNSQGEDTGQGVWSCTGFFIDNKGDFITAKHCSYQKQFFVIYNGKQVKAELIARSSIHDIALFHADLTETKYLAFNPTEVTQQGTIPSGTYGYPVPDILGNDLKETTGTASNSHIIWDHVDTTAKACPGNSGGPMVDGLGNVIGILTGAFDSNIIDKNGCAIPSFGIKSQNAVDLIQSSGLVAYNTSIYGPINFDLYDNLEDIIFLMYCINP